MLRSHVAAKLTTKSTLTARQLAPHRGQASALQAGGSEQPPGSELGHPRGGRLYPDKPSSQVWARNPGSLGSHEDSVGFLLLPLPMAGEVPGLPGGGLEGTSSAKQSSGSRKATGPCPQPPASAWLPDARSPSDRKVLGRERESRKHCQPFGVRLQGWDVPWGVHLGTWEQNSPDQFNRFLGGEGPSIAGLHVNEDGQC